MKYYSCPDRMCGAMDCPRCRPENFRCGVFIDDTEAEEEEVEDAEEEDDIAS